MFKKIKIENYKRRIPSIQIKLLVRKPSQNNYAFWYINIYIIVHIKIEFQILKEIAR